MDKIILQNQIKIMKALIEIIEITYSRSDTVEDLKNTIMFTEQYIKNTV